MIASEDAHAYDGDGDRIVRWQEKFPLASCRQEIVNGNGRKSIWAWHATAESFKRYGRGMICIIPMSRAFRRPAASAGGKRSVWDEIRPEVRAEGDHASIKFVREHETNLSLSINPRKELIAS